VSGDGDERDLQSHVARVAPTGRNEATRITRDPDQARMDAREMRRRFVKVLRVLPKARPPKGPGYVLFAARADKLAVLNLPVDTGSFAVLGRHDRADVVLAQDEEVSLRHLLATVVRLSDGAMALRVIDLRAGLPFFLDDDVPRRSIVAAGPVVLRLGRYIIGGIPSDDEGRRGLVEEVQDATSLVQEVEEAQGVPAQSRSAPGFTHVSSLGRPSTIAELTGTLLPGHARIRVQRETHSASVDVPENALEQGVIVGRAERCVDGGIRNVLTVEISRAHLLLLKDAEHVDAYDLGSVNGTWSGNRRIRHVRLYDGGTNLLLGGPNGVKLRWRRGDDG
jgi:hypothetical protein